MEKSQTSFNIENELSKVKIPIPLLELVKKDVYRSQFVKALQIEEGYVSVNITDDQPKLLFEPEVDGIPQDDSVPPFYIRLNIHDFILHNAMLDSGASHNLMPKEIMEKLGLDIKDLINTFTPMIWIE